MFRKLSETFRNAPSGYRPGATLAQVRRNLAGMRFDELEPARGRFSTVDGELAFEVRELPQSQFLMHLVLSEFVLQVPAARQGELRFECAHSGALRRRGIVCWQRAGDPLAGARIIERLIDSTELREVLLPLDFRRLTLERGKGGWTVRLEHMGASEVVNRMPSFRRYIRLDRDQRFYLLATLARLQRLLGDV
ncbi:hypothetical protein D9M68_407360 [compost metagenome]|uniref:DUF3156 family protein n=1 Tax=Pseudomonas jinjuensis TaxID=198616 RepID=A0A1H0CWG6_9PSED|nr:DUF3156 family protein [Pseudomonas jinjuensis]SDN61981.1 Protein of unknown function [Pseudomonas jinjuensis]